jgi:hypothetical protein
MLYCCFTIALLLFNYCFTTALLAVAVGFGASSRSRQPQVVSASQIVSSKVVKYIQISPFFFKKF